MRYLFTALGDSKNCGCHRRSLLLGRLFLSPVRFDFSVGYHLRWLCVCSSVTVVWLFSLFALLIVTEDSVAWCYSKSCVCVFVCVCACLRVCTRIVSCCHRCFFYVAILIATRAIVSASMCIVTACITVFLLCHHCCHYCLSAATAPATRFVVLRLGRLVACAFLSLRMLWIATVPVCVCVCVTSASAPHRPSRLHWVCRFIVALPQGIVELWWSAEMGKYQGSRMTCAQLVARLTQEKARISPSTQQRYVCEVTLQYSCTTH